MGVVLRNTYLYRQYLKPQDRRTFADNSSFYSIDNLNMTQQFDQLKELKIVASSRQEPIDFSKLKAPILSFVNIAHAETAEMIVPTQLTGLSVTFCKNLQKIHTPSSANLEGMSRLKYLTLVKTGVRVSSLPKTLEFLQLSMDAYDDIDFIPRNIPKIYIKSNQSITTLSLKDFVDMTSVTIEGFSELRTIESFPPNVRTIIIMDCDNLEDIPHLSQYDTLTFCSLDGNFTHLEKLKKSDCSPAKIKYRESSGNSDIKIAPVKKIKPKHFTLDTTTFTDAKTEYRPTYSIYQGPKQERVDPRDMNMIVESV